MYATHISPLARRRWAGLGVSHQVVHQPSFDTDDVDYVDLVMSVCYQ